ncbi:CinA family nicotinamide mononucleotide deamidase-related protein [bacterium]|nr:MAG: CinA family nicotinamide mononucleotide deamidase-related protein [bacterium]
MPVAEIIAIGTELLLGEIQDTNTKHLARTLRDKGIDIYRATLVGDNSTRISNLILEAANRADIIITTGGLGPTVDDPTRDAAALAMGVQSHFNPELWGQIQARFQRMARIPTENNKRQAYLPDGAMVIENPVGTAPAFYGVVNNRSLLVCLPGVPREMEYLLENAVVPLLEIRFNLRETIRAVVLHCAGVGESQVDEWIGDLETCANPTVGLLAHPGIVDIRVTAKAESQAIADQMIAEMVQKVRERVGNIVYGQDADTLESAVTSLLLKNEFSLIIAGDGSQSTLVARLLPPASTLIKIQDSKINPFERSVDLLRNSVAQAQNAIGLAIALTHSDSNRRNRLELAFVTPLEVITETRQYSGPEGNIPAWEVNYALNFLRINLLNHHNHKE